MTALVLALVSVVVVNRLDDYFRDQVKADLTGRAATIRLLATGLVAQAVDRSESPVVALDGTLNPAVDSTLSSYVATLAQVGQADLTLQIGAVDQNTSGTSLVPSPDGTFSAELRTEPGKDQARDAPISFDETVAVTAPTRYGLRIALTNPYTVRVATLTTITTLLLVVAIVALGVAIVVAAIVARRFARPIIRLTEASRSLAEGDLTSRVPSEQATGTSSETAALSRQFNLMADRLEDSVAIIRRDRDRSRDFLADVSHELRTPIAAMRTFVELLQGPAGSDEAARQEFLESSAQQLERLDWLAQNLLELSKLDSGLVLLDLRPEDLRASVESAVEQAAPTAERRGLRLEMDLPDAPLRIRHDPQRIGQVVSNLVGNALKFTARNGVVRVRLRPQPNGAEIEVSDTGVGIDANELPRIFERFYRGSRSSEARSSGSGLGLAIVKSIVDMHAGRIAVETRPGHGSTFTVILPHDPRSPAPAEGEASADAATVPARAPSVGQGHVTNSSPTEAAHLNHGASQ